MQAHAANGMPVLISYATKSPWLERLYVKSFDRILIDSGAFSVMNTGAVVDVVEYMEWASRYTWADAIAGLDDIEGDWRKSLRNYRHGGFPTFHDSDPPELLDDLIPLARERGGWIGVGLVPPREGKDRFVASTLERMPADLHVHGWALRRYAHFRRFDSFDSTNWFRDGAKILQFAPWLTPAEALDIVVKRYKREVRSDVRRDEDEKDNQLGIRWD